MAQLESVRRDPTSKSLCLALERATFRRRQSRRRWPTVPSAFERTKDTTITCLSRPWYLSMVFISRNG